jgi:hypothetical protein
MAIKHHKSYKAMLAYMDVCMWVVAWRKKLSLEKKIVTSGTSIVIFDKRRGWQEPWSHGMAFRKRWVLSFMIWMKIGISAETRACIDAEVKRITDSSYQRAKKLLTKHKKEHKLLAECLLKFETLTGEEVRNIVLHRA